MDIHGVTDYAQYAHVYMSIYYKNKYMYTACRIYVDSDSARCYIHVKNCAF